MPLRAAPGGRYTERMTTVLIAEQRALSEAAQYIRNHIDVTPEIAIILGSGLGPLADEVENATVLDYHDIPNFPRSTVSGHAGKLVIGQLAGRNVVVMQGRIHLYEGVDARTAVFPVALFHELGVTSLFVTNACGGLNPSFVAGDLMLQLDFINHTGQTPLTGPNAEPHPRFPVMFDCYDAEYADTAFAAARELGIDLQRGVYLAISGPAYATRAELRAFRSWGADAVGMSTVHEVIKARHVGMRVLGISCVTDMALPDREEHADHEFVLRTAERAGANFRALVKHVLPQL